ncbi:MAG TPA: aldo/keto reductase [Cryomorphaceae bacterium]|nr:aldo/keto reductase [Cryomorphaceae bacterium]HKL40832.1 aldo/keto reductase [Cryomorphaceae bacterium]
MKSKIIIGCMSWGQWGKELSTKEQTDLIQFCLENGHDTFDHADIYGDYTTEEAFGNALRESRVRREEIRLISKCGIQHDGDTRPNRVKHYNYSKDYIIWSAEQSLNNLGTDYLDTFLLHRPSPLMHPDEIAEAITHLQKSGKIKEFGVSNFTPSQIGLLSDKVKVSANQVEFSLTQPSAMEDGTFDFLLQNGIRAMSWSPLGGVFKKQNEQTQRVKKVLNSLTHKYQTTEDVLLLAWILKHPVKVSPVIGTTNRDRIKNSSRALELDMELEDWFILLEASRGHKVA